MLFAGFAGRHRPDGDLLCPSIAIPGAGIAIHGAGRFCQCLRKNDCHQYWLSDLGKKAKAITDEVEPLRNELITKYGEKTSEETVEVLPWIDEKNEEGAVTSRKPNPKFLEFEREYTELFNQEREIEHRVFFIEDFEDVKSENDYPIFRKFCTSREESPLSVVK